jgi:glycosyltransferase involved in cell wall biosynthesis
MNWVFLDSIRWDYDVATPFARPLGGSQSAMSYLALALASRGEQVTTLTATSKPRQVGSIRCLRFEDIPAEVFAPSDTIIVVNAGPADLGRAIREVIPRGKPLVLWTGHAPDQPAVVGLRDPEILAPWDRIVCVSDWQKRMFHERLHVPLERMEILRNGIAPAFQNMFATAEQLATAKQGPLRLTYTSTPFRGLAVLLACFPAIYKRHPDCQLDVYSSMLVYDQPAAGDPYQKLYDQCRATPGINYRGSISQPELAKELAPVSLLAYPSTFAETSCIAVMEAMAAGLLIVTSDLGALAETTGGHARLVPPAGGERTQEQFAIDYAKVLDQALTDLKADPAGFAQRMIEQSRAVNATGSYAVRASEWLAAAARWLENT